MQLSACATLHSKSTRLPGCVFSDMTTATGLRWKCRLSWVLLHAVPQVHKLEAALSWHLQQGSKLWDTEAKTVPS